MPGNLGTQRATCPNSYILCLICHPTIRNLWIRLVAGTQYLGYKFIEQKNGLLWNFVTSTKFLHKGDTNGDIGAKISTQL